MDKDPIREQAVIEAYKLFIQSPYYQRTMYADGGFAREETVTITANTIEKHLREKAELQQEITTLHSHNLVLVEALKDAHQKSRDIYSELVMSNNPHCDQWSSPAVILKQQESKLHQALSSPSSEKYLKMVRVVDFAERHLSSGWKEVHIGWRRMMTKVILSPEEHERFTEALKSYNSEKGGE